MANFNSPFLEVPSRARGLRPGGEARGHGAGPAAVRSAALSPPPSRCSSGTGRRPNRGFPCGLCVQNGHEGLPQVHLPPEQGTGRSPAVFLPMGAPGDGPSKDTGDGDPGGLSGQAWMGKGRVRGSAG